MENEIKKELTEIEEVVAETAETAKENAAAVEETVTEAVEEICEPVALDETAVEETAEAVEETLTETVAETPAEAVAEEIAEAPAETAAEETAETVKETPTETVAAAPAETSAVTPEKPKSLGKRIVSAIFGWLGIFTSSTSVLGIVFGIISICLGFSAKKKSGKGRFAITLGFISLILGVLFLAAAIYLVYCLFVNFDWTVETFNLPKEFADAWNSIIG